MPQRKISQDWLCPLYSGKREWLRYRRAYCGGAFVWVRTARAEETLIKLLLSAKREEVCKRSIKGKAIKGNHREQAHIQKITSQRGLLLGNPWAIQEKESFCHVMARVAAETGLAQHPANTAEYGDFHLSKILSLGTQFHSVEPQQFRGHGLQVKRKDRVSLRAAYVLWWMSSSV